MSLKCPRTQVTIMCRTQNSAAVWPGSKVHFAITNPPMNWVVVDLGKFPDVHPNPAHAGGPASPRTGVQRAAGRYAGPPGATLQPTAGDVRLAVGVEVTDLD